MKYAEIISRSEAQLKFGVIPNNNIYNENLDELAEIIIQHSDAEYADIRFKGCRYIFPTNKLKAQNDPTLNFSSDLFGFAGLVSVRNQADINEWRVRGALRTLRLS